MTSLKETAVYQALSQDDSLEVQKLLSEGADPNVKDEKGQTYLHHAILKPVSKETFKPLLAFVDVTERDEQGNNILDLALEDERTPDWAEEEVRDWMMKAVLDMDEERLEQMVLGGWPYFPTDEIDKIRERSEEAADFLERIPEFEERMKFVHDAIYEGDIRTVTQHMDRKKLALARDHTGIPPLQKAILFEETTIVRHIVENFPSAINLKDNMGRTALHYAGASRDGGHVFKVLIQAGASENVADVTGRLPKDYKEQPELLNVKGMQKHLRQLASQAARRARSRATTYSSRMTTRENTGYELKPSRGAGFRVSESLRGMAMAADMHTKRNVTPPETSDSKYIADQLGHVLTMGLAELCQRRPWDPIEYLAHYLYKHAENQAYAQRQVALVKELAEDEKRAEMEKEMKRRRREEIKRQREEKARKKQEEEEERKRMLAEKERLEKAQIMPTLKEEAEPEPDRGSKGQTKLHEEAASPGGNVAALIAQDFSVAERDWQGNTPRDLAEQKGLTDNVNAIDDYVLSLVQENKWEKLEELVNRGYTTLPNFAEKFPDGMPEEAAAFVGVIPEIQERMAAFHEALLRGMDRESLGFMDRKKLLESKNKQGMGVLHMAVMGESSGAVRHVIENAPNCVQDRDNLGRTALHYAAGLRDGGHMYKLLTENGGADAGAKDYDDNTPKFFLETPGALDTKALRKQWFGIEEVVEGTAPTEGTEETAAAQEPGEAQEATEDQAEEAEGQAEEAGEEGAEQQEAED